MKLQNTVVRRSVSVCELICLLGIWPLWLMHTPIRSGEYGPVIYRSLGLIVSMRKPALSVTPEKASLELSEGSMHCTLEDGAYKENEQSFRVQHFVCGVHGRRGVVKDSSTKNFEFVPGSESDESGRIRFPIRLMVRRFMPPAL